MWRLRKRVCSASLCRSALEHIRIELLFGSICDGQCDGIKNGINIESLFGDPSLPCLWKTNVCIDNTIFSKEQTRAHRTKVRKHVWDLHCCNEDMKKMRMLVSTTNLYLRASEDIGNRWDRTRNTLHPTSLSAWRHFFYVLRHAHKNFPIIFWIIERCVFHEH